MNELPYNLEAEQATLGSVLLNRDAIVVLAPWLKPSAFYDERHAWIYTAMLACFHDRVPPDTRMVADRLKQANRFDAIGGYAYLARLLGDVPTSFHVEHYAAVVERHAVERRGIMAAGKIAALLYAPGDIEAKIAAAHAELTTALDRDSAVSGLEPISAILARRYEAVINGTPPGICTGIADYDAITGGLLPGRLVILAGRPGQGKTAIGTQIAVTVAQQGKVVCLFSLEMPREEVADRVAALKGSINTQHLTQHRLTDGEIAGFVDVCGWAEGLPLYVEDKSGITSDYVRATAMRLRAECDGLDLVVVDYVQLMTAPRKDRNREQEVSDISRSMKALAKELGCPVLALAQLNRAVDHRADPTPVLADLRESGSLEQDADQVVFIVRPELYGIEGRAGEADLTIAKHRGGALGKMRLRFDAAHTRFFGIDRWHDTEGQHYANHNND